MDLLVSSSGTPSPICSDARRQPPAIPNPVRVWNRVQCRPCRERPTFSPISTPEQVASGLESPASALYNAFTEEERRKKRRPAAGRSNIFLRSQYGSLPVFRRPPISTPPAPHSQTPAARGPRRGRALAPARCPSPCRPAPEPHDGPRPLGPPVLAAVGGAAERGDVLRG